jgi:putative transposase
MKRSRFTEEQIAEVLKEVDAGTKIGELARRHVVSQATIYNWKSKHGGALGSESKRLRALEEENSKLKQILVDAILEKADLKALLNQK